MTVLRPESVSRRQLPVNFNPGDAHLFSHDLEVVLPPVRLRTLHHVSASAEGVLFQRGKMFPESFALPANRADWKTSSVVKFYLLNYLLRSRRRFDSDGVWVVDNWSYGYFHWLADVLPRLITVRERLKDLVLLLPHSYKDLAFVQPSLTPFALGSIEYTGENEVLLCRKLLMPSHTAPSGHFNESLIREVRDLLVGFFAVKSAQAPDDRVYVSRGRAAKRRIINEEEVVDVLRQYDFRMVHAEDYSFEEQINIASQARYLVSNHGAGLTNMLFMNAGGNVLELRCANDTINNCYFAMAAALHLNYFYQGCDPVNGETPHTADVRVDVSILRTNLELMLRR